MPGKGGTSHSVQPPKAPAPVRGKRKVSRRKRGRNLGGLGRKNHKKRRGAVAPSVGGKLGIGVTPVTVKKSDKAPNLLLDDDQEN